MVSPWVLVPGAAGKQKCRSKEGAGEVYEKSLEMRHFRALTYPEEPKRGPSRATELAPEGQDEEHGFNGGRWVYNGRCPGCEKGNPGSMH